MIEIVVGDNQLKPELIRSDDLLSVRIGIDHDFDDILDLCAGSLTNDELAMVHRLWADDEFPRSFTRKGSELIIRARQA